MSQFDTRTWGTTRNCRGCRYWSEQLAETRNGVVHAACLAPAGRGTYRTGGYACSSYASGELGAVDDPAGNPYEEEQAA